MKSINRFLGSEDFNNRVAKSKFAKMPLFAKSNTGAISLQGDHGQVAFRNIKIRVIESGGVEWQGLSVNLSTFGTKIPSRGPITPGASVRLEFTLPDDLPLFALAQFVRTDPDGHAYRFVNLTATEYRRLSEVVQLLKTD